MSNLEADSSGKFGGDKFDVSGHDCYAFIAIRISNLEDDKATGGHVGSISQWILFEQGIKRQ